MLLHVTLKKEKKITTRLIKIKPNYSKNGKKLFYINLIKSQLHVDILAKE